MSDATRKDSLLGKAFGITGADLLGFGSGSK